MTHECDLKRVEWSDSPDVGERDVYLNGSCSECGRRFQKVFEPVGIWDVEKEEYVELL